MWPSAPPPCPTPVIPASGGPPPSLDNLPPPVRKCQAPSSKAAGKTKKSSKILEKVVTSPRAVKPAKRSANFMAKELFEVVQAAITVKFFEAKDGEKGEREKEMGDMLRKSGVEGSNGVMKTCMFELLTWHGHEVCIYAFKISFDQFPTPTQFYLRTTRRHPKPFRRPSMIQATKFPWARHSISSCS